MANLFIKSKRGELYFSIHVLMVRLENILSQQVKGGRIKKGLANIL